MLNERVIGGANLVFCTPTSAGKSLVAELLICRAFMRQKKVRRLCDVACLALPQRRLSIAQALLALPFVSMVEEAYSRLSTTFRQVHPSTSAPNALGDLSSGGLCSGALGRSGCPNGRR